MAGLPSVAGSSQAWAAVGSMWSTSFNGGWIADQSIGSTGGFTVLCSPTSSGYIFSSSGDGTTGASGNSFYALGRPVRILQNSTTFYGWVASAAVASGVTTVGLSSGSASGALSTGLAFTSVAVGVPTTLPASITPAATARFHREDGSWAAPVTTNGTAVVATQENTTSATYVDLTTPGPAVTVTTGTRALVILTGQIQSTTAARQVWMGFAVSGATTVAAADTQALMLTTSGISAPTIQVSASFLVTGLTAGSNTFTAKYKSDSGATAYFSNRGITVINMGS